MRGWSFRILLPSWWAQGTEAARNGDAQAIPDLIAAGANVNSNEKGQTPLHVAVYYHRVTTVTALLNSENIDLKIKDTEGMTALQWARKICYAPPKWANYPLTERQ